MCTSCNRYKIFEGFYRNCKSKDGYLQKCIKCSTPSKIKIFKAHIKYHYGISFEEWESRLKDQQGRCGVCEEPMYDPVVDHCHKSGDIRMLLCRQCNIAAGAVRDNPEIATKLAIYLQRSFNGV